MVKTVRPIGLQKVEKKYYKIRLNTYLPTCISLSIAGGRGGRIRINYFSEFSWSFLNIDLYTSY